MGISTLNQDLDYYGLSLTLGGGEVWLLDLTYAYGVFANGGVMMGQPTELPRSGYRLLDPVSILRVEDAEGVMVLAGAGSDLDVVATGRTVEELCDLMTEQLLLDPGELRVGVCLADPATLPFTEGIESRLEASGRPIELVRYRVGPSIAAHTGPGTAGGFVYPR